MSHVLGLFGTRSGSEREAAKEKMSTGNVDHAIAAHIEGSSYRPRLRTARLVPQSLAIDAV
jgi:hypothetical protein